MQLQLGETCLRVDVPDHWHKPEEDPQLLQHALLVAEEHGATWLEMWHRGEQILCRLVVP